MGGILSHRVTKVLGGMIVLLLGLYLVVHAISAAAFSALEARETEANVRRVEQAVVARTAALESVAGDWATWDDTYRLIAGDNPGFADANMQGSMLATLRVDLMAFVTDAGRIVDSRRADLDSGRIVEFPGDVATVLRSTPDYLRLPRVGQGSSGLIMTDEGPLLFAARAVTDNEAVATPHGIIFVGRYLDAAEVARLSSQTKLNVSVHDAADLASLPADVAAAFAAASTRTVVAASSETTIAGHAVMLDVEGRSGLVFTVRSLREIHAAGQHSLLNSGVAMVVFAIIAMSLVTVALVRQYRENVERQRAETAMRASEERFRGLVTNMADAVLGLDAEGRVVFANPQAAILSGYSTEELAGMHYSSLMPAAAAERIRSRTRVAPGETESCETQLEHASGKAVPVELSISAVDAGRNGVISQWIARDITERKRHEEELVRLADHDHLTGLINRRRFEEELDRALERCRRGGRPGVLMWVDLDGLKDINDTFGHTSGDEVLVGITNILECELPPGSVLSRLGGDEFGILLQDIGVDTALAVSEGLLAKVNECEFLFDEQVVHLTGSIGLTEFPGHGTTPRELLSRADMAMYRAKEEDRNSCRVYRPDEDWTDELASRFEWTSVIEKALAEERFAVYAQPIVRLSDRSVDRYELLIRMLAEDGSLVPPGDFLPVAERVGLIHQIDRWMVRQAIALLAAYPEGGGTRFDVNLSGTVLTDPLLLPLIESELERLGVDPSRLGVEITETVAICDMAKARSFIEALKDIGCAVTLDDFGSGFSSFYYLNNLPIDGLKIDGAFVKNLVRSTKDQHVVKAIVELTRGFGIVATAEWVEDQRTLEVLRSYGVECGQGFAIGRPAPVGDVFGQPAPVLEAGDAPSSARLSSLRGLAPVGYRGASGS